MNKAFGHALPFFLMLAGMAVDVSAGIIYTDIHAYMYIHKYSAKESFSAPSNVRLMLPSSAPVHPYTNLYPQTM
jgi:hypothetical protein